MKLILLTNRNVTFLPLPCVQSNLPNSKAFAHSFEIWVVLYHQSYAFYFWYLLSVYESSFVSDYATSYISETWFFLKTMEFQLWISVNMIMEINFWLLNKKKVSQTPFLGLKPFTYIKGVFITNSKLKRVHFSLFQIHFCY